jgi:hypothetical protein
LGRSPFDTIKRRRVGKMGISPILEFENKEWAELGVNQTLTLSLLTF